MTWTPQWAEGIGMVPFTIGAPARHGLRPGPHAWPALGDGMRIAGYWLRELPPDRIVEVFDDAADRWTDRAFLPRRAVIDAAVASTGIPATTLQRLLDAELGTCRRSTLLTARGWQPASGTHPSSVTLGIMSGAVPGTIARALIRVLLSGSAVVARVPAREPGFAAAFTRCVASIEPLIADAVLITSWRRDDTVALRGALSQVDTIRFDGMVRPGRADAARIVRH